MSVFSAAETNQCPVDAIPFSILSTGGLLLHSYSYRKSYHLNWTYVRCGLILDHILVVNVLSKCDNGFNKHVEDNTLIRVT